MRIPLLDIRNSAPLWSRRLRARRDGPNLLRKNGVRSPMPEPGELRDLGKRLEKARRQSEPRPQEAPPSSLGIAGRFATELMVAVAFGGGLGWLLDRWLGTRPIFLVVMVVLGAGAGIRNVMRAAQELNARLGTPGKDEET